MRRCSPSAAVFTIGIGNTTAVSDFGDVINAAAGTAREPTFASARVGGVHGAWPHSVAAGIRQAYQQIIHNS
jgi:hypothetical protein